MKHCIKVQLSGKIPGDGAPVNDGIHEVYAADVKAAKVVAGLSFAGGAYRVWIDGELTAGPINELLDTQLVGPLVSLA